MERLLAVIFDEFGFEVKLTPESKDHGRDIILKFHLQGAPTTFLLEVKHWRSGKRVGTGVSSSSGFTQEALALTEIERRHEKPGDDAKVISLCRTYHRHRAGLWSPPVALQELVFEGTQ